MSRSNAFDSSDEASFKEGRIRPLFTLLQDIDDEEKVLEWVNNTYSTELQRVLPYREQAIRHVALYRNKWYSSDSNQSGRASSAEASTLGLGISSNKPSKITANYLYDITNQRVSRVLRNPSTVEVNPANDEYRDRIAAKVVGAWVKYLFYVNDFDRLRARVSKSAFTMGEAYIWVRWNPDMGNVHPDWLEEEESAKREGRPPRLPLKDDKGNQIIGVDNEPLWTEKPVKTGDVEFLYCSPLNTIPQFCGDFERSEYFFYEYYEDIDVLKALYPNQAEKIAEDKSDGDDPISKWRNMSGMFNGPQQGKVLVRCFRQKPTELLAGGRWIVATQKAVLENKPLETREEGLHLVRLTDIDNPDEQRGQSFYVQGKVTSAAINDLTSMSMRNMKLLAHPKWSIPKGSVIKKDALGNDVGMVEFSGPIEPKIQVPPPMNGENMAVKTDLKNDLQAILGSSPAERGQIPSNVRTAAGLQALYEQDDMRNSEGNLKQAAFIRECVEAAVNLASAYYEKDDKRLIPVVGRDNRYIVKEFDPALLTRGFTVRVANDSGLPTSKAVRFDMAMQIAKEMPNYATEERIGELLQWGNLGKILDAATVAKQAAEAENEAMLSLEPIQEPTPIEQLLVHWETHVRDMQERSFMADTPPEVKKAFLDHVMATEMLMIEAAKRNPAFAVELVKIKQYPLLYTPGAEDFMLLDAARSGNPLPLQMVQQLYDVGAAALQAAGVGGQAPPAAGAGGVNPQTNGPQGTATLNQQSPDTISAPATNAATQQAPPPKAA